MFTAILVIVTYFEFDPCTKANLINLTSLLDHRTLMSSTN